MATAEQVFARGALRNEHEAASGLKADWTMTVLLAWFFGGVVLDGWAHSHGRVDQSFFTPWHAVLYSGFGLAAAGLVGVVLLNRLRGFEGTRAIPTGYGLGLVGIAIFAFGGLFDLVWHTLFGIEQNVEAALSPSHLLLVAGMTLLLSTPLRAAWRRHGVRPGLAALLPMLLSLMLTLSGLSFITQYAHPYVTLWPVMYQRSQDTQIVAITGILIQTGLLMGFVLLAVRRWELPAGSLTLILTLNAALLSVMQDTYIMIPICLVAGIGADALNLWLRPSVERPIALRVFAASVPSILYVCYFAALGLTQGLTWTTHVWTGAIVMAASVGWLLSYAFIPPRMPETVAR